MTTEEFNRTFVSEQMDTLFLSYKEWKHRIQKSSEDHSFFLDKAILGIASGAIGLLLTIFNDQNSECTVLLKISLVLFAISISCVLLSFFFKLRDLEDESVFCNDWFDSKFKLLKKINLKVPLTDQEDLFQEIAKADKKPSNLSSKVVIFTNNSASIFVSLGIGFAVLFYIVSV